MEDFFPIETPYNSKEYEIMKNIVNMGIDSHLEGFTKSEFKKSPHFNNKFLWNIHNSELPILYRRMEHLYNEKQDEDYLSLLEDIKSVVNEKESELGEMVDPYDPMDANETPDGQPTPTSDLNEFEMDEAEVKEMIRKELYSMQDENFSDSLANQHGENLKPQTIDETTDQERYERVVFMQGDEADEVMNILNNDGRDAAMEYLGQWHDFGHHMGSDKIGAGTQDKTYEKDGYIMNWNPYLPYIGLTYDTHYGQEAQTVEEDSQMKRHQAGQREKTVPLGQHAPHSQAALNENNLKITHDLVDYDVQQVGDNTFKMKNFFGLDGIDILKRKNGWNDAAGEYHDMFHVDVEEDGSSITIQLYPSIIEENNGDIAEALVSAITIIDNHYDSVGWEMLSNPVH